MYKILCLHRNISCLVILGLALTQSAQAQHAIDIQKKSIKGQHYEAILLYDQMAKRRTTLDSELAAAKSAWALGLTKRASQQFDEVLRQGNLSTDQKARLLLTRGVIEFQEGRYQVAELYVEKVMKILKVPSSLRGKAWMLWAESLYEQGSFGPAEIKYRNALEELTGDLASDVHFKLGLCLARLGKFKEAQQHLESLPVTHEQTPKAVRELATIALQQENYEDVEFWLERGREQFPEHFIDSWVDYALLQVAIAENDQKKVKQIHESVVNKYPPSDHWLNLIVASVEASRWQAKAQLTGEVND